MKKAIVLFLFLFVSLTSCSNSEDSATSIDITQINTTWNLQQALLDGKEVSSSYKIQFTTAKTVKFYYLNPISNTKFGPDIIDNGNYVINKNTLIITWNSSDPGKETTQFEILELSSAKLKIKSVIKNEGTLIETYTK